MRGHVSNKRKQNIISIEIALVRTVYATVCSGCRIREQSKIKDVEFSFLARPKKERKGREFEKKHMSVCMSFSMALLKNKKV